jgi:hypothetical protein
MGLEEPRDSFLDKETSEGLLPTISLVNVPHPRIPNLYQSCFEYVEPWQWSPETERVETGHWFFAGESEPHLP